MDSQGENSSHNLPRIADFRLKYSILREDTKNNILGRKRRLKEKFTASVTF